MSIRHLRLSALALSLFIGLPLLLNAGALHDAEHGFSITIPPEFGPNDTPTGSETIIHSFIIGEPSDDALSTVLTIERLPWTFPPSERMDPALLAIPDNVTLSIEDISWENLTLDLARHEVHSPSGLTFVNYSVQIPVSPNAIQLNVGSSIENEADAKSHLKNILKSFQTTSLATENPGITSFAQSGSGKGSDFASLLGALAVAALVGLIIIFVLARLRRDDDKHSS